jgi:hypothetical protein
VHWIQTLLRPDPLQSLCTPSGSAGVGEFLDQLCKLQVCKKRATGSSRYSAAGCYGDYGSEAPRGLDRIRQFITGDGTAPLGETP